MAINLNRVRGDRSPYRLVVREGDTLRSLSELLEVEPTALRAANPNVDLDELVPGMELIIPDTSVIEIDHSPEASIEAEDDAPGASEATLSDTSASEAAGNVISFPSRILAQELSETGTTALRPDDHDEAARTDADGAADVSEKEQLSGATCEGSSADVERQEDRAAATEPQNNSSQRSASEQRSSTDTETTRPRFETISWKPFPKI